MSEAWIGLIGALIGASAGLGGAAITSHFADKRALGAEIRTATAQMAARARYPAYVRRALDHELVGREHIAELVTTWGEDMAAAHSRLLVLGDVDIVSAADFLWQRATDHLLALLGEDHAGATAEELELVVENLIRELQIVVGRQFGGDAVNEGNARD